MAVALLACVALQLAATPTSLAPREFDCDRALRVVLESNALELETLEGRRRLELTLARFGRGEASCAVASAAATIDGVRVEYDRGALVEWLVDGAQGLEHGFTLLERPEGEGEVELALEFRGGLRARVLKGGRDVDFVDECGAPAIGYFGLHVQDADGDALDARWRARRDELVLGIDDADARYPLTVDPTFVTYEGSFSQPLTNFGRQVSLSGQTAFIGSRNPGPFGSGSSTAAFYGRGATGWTHQGSFNGSGHYSSDVDVSGDFAVVGAPYLSDLMYVYQRVTGTWSLMQVISEYDDGHDWYGYAVAIDGDYCAASEPQALDYSLPIHLYQRTGSTWNEVGVYEDPTGFLTGETLDLAMPYMVAGDTEWGNAAQDEIGRAKVFLVGSGGGPAQAALLAPDRADYDHFGTSVAIDGTRIVVGAPGHDHLGANLGGAYVFELVGSTWTFVTELVPTSPTTGSSLGYDVAIDGDRIVVGGIRVAFVFELVAGVWTEIAQLTSPVAATTFGREVAIDGTHVLVGAGDISTVFAYELSGAPGPQTYCTAKINSQGCSPAIGWSGSASATLAQPFFVDASNVINNKGGTLYYGVSGQLAAPFQGGFQCVAPPRRRTGVQISGGNPAPDDCSGAYAYDFNARIQSGVDPALAAGVIVDAQYWSRDGAASFQTGLTNAVEFTISP